MKKNKLGYLLLLIVFITDLLLPYAKANDPSVITTVTTWICFYSLICFSYFLGIIAKKDKNSFKNGIILYLIINLLFNIVACKCSLNIMLPFYTTKLILCFIIWSLVAKYFDKLLYMPFLFAVSILMGFVNINIVLSWLICLFPFFLIGYHDMFSIVNKNKVINKYKYIIASLIIVILFVAIFIILSKYHVSLDILRLNSFVGRKQLVFRIGYYFIGLGIMYALNLIFNNDKNNDYSKFIVVYALASFVYAIFYNLVNINYYSNLYLPLAGITSLIIIIGLSNDYVFKYIKKVLDYNFNNKYIIVGCLSVLILCMLIPNLKNKYMEYPIYEEMTSSEQSEIDNAISISFVGDLIMLENQLRSAYNEGEYDFDPMFQYTTKYLESSSYAIGVLEGPVASGNYSQGNFDDNVNLRLNYPTSFITSIKKSGIDLVTIANNHILDKGVDSLKETETNLNKEGLDYVGTNSKRYTITNIEGLKVGILSYTYGANYYTENELLDLNVVPMLVSPGSVNFNKVKKDVKSDFDKLKKENVDLIIVLPHMGTQFSHETDAYQNTWNKIFVDNGADIVFGDHAHAVQHIQYMGDSIVVNCPGNFANQYTKNDGDATSIVEVYINRETKKVMSSSVIPMYTQGNSDGFYRALPIYDIVNDDELNKTFSKYELERVSEVHKLITKTMLGVELPLDNVEYKLYLFEDGYKRSSIRSTYIDTIDQNSIVNVLNNSETVCFIGDSITEGTVIGGYGWYEPLLNQYNIKAKRVAKGSYTTKLMLKNKEKELEDCKADTYIIALGTNDVRYRDESICSMDSEEYVENMDKIISIVNNENKNIVLISPWRSTDNDSFAKMSVDKKNELFDEYDDALENYANKNGYIYINPNELIFESVNKKPDYYLKDFIHPNKSHGIELYSWAVLNAN